MLNLMNKIKNKKVHHIKIKLIFKQNKRFEANLISFFLTILKLFLILLYLMFVFPYKNNNKCILLLKFCN